MARATFPGKAGNRRRRLLGSSALDPRAALLGLAAVGCATAILPQPAIANPQGGVVVGGDATIRTQPGRTTIDQSSDRVIIDWDSFSIAPGETTRFNQPGRDAIALNRVTGGAVSDIAGTLEANGNVWLVNPNGVLIQQGARIDVNGLLATTADIANADFLAGRFVFDKPSPKAGATVVNKGEISIGERGLAALVAPGVSNAGTITGQLGQVVLAGAPTFTIDLAGDGLINFDITSRVAQAPDGQAELVRNDGRIIAPGGTVRISASAAAGVIDEVINVAGVVEATAVTRQGGRIILSGGDSGRVTVAGTLDASGAQAGQTGGRVEVLGDRVALVDEARIDVGGDAGGGTVLVGGDYQGKGSGPNATRTYVGVDTEIVADAGTRGDGGRVIVWADEATHVAGAISARGGAAGGDGGFVETSGKETLQVTGTARVDTGAPEGKTGQWLLDPTFVTVVSSEGDTSNLADVDQFLDPDANSGGTWVEVSAINAAETDVILQATDWIIVEAPIAFANSDVGFVAQAGEGIGVFADITTQGGRIHLEADSPHASDVGGDGSGDVVLPAGFELVSNGGSITLIGAGFSGDEGGGFSRIDAGSGAIAIAFSRDNAPFQVGSDFFSFGFPAGLLDDLTTSGVLTLGQAMTAGDNGRGAGALQLTAGTLEIGTSIAPDVGALRLVSRGGIDQSSETTITVGSLALIAGGAISLNEPNDGGTLAVDAPGQSVTFRDRNALTIGAAAGISGLDAASVDLFAGDDIAFLVEIGQENPVGSLSLTTEGDVTINERFRAGSLILDIGGDFSNRNFGPTARAGEGLELGALTIERARSVEGYGTINGRSGAAAALEPDAEPNNPAYTFNGCIIGSTEPCVADIQQPPLDEALPRFDEIAAAAADRLQLRLVPDQLLIPVPSQVSAGGEESLYANDGNEELW